MFRPSRTALAATTLSLAASVFAMPSAAYAADTTTSLGATQMAAELKAVASTSTTAAANGLKADLSVVASEITMTASYVVDTPHKIAYTREPFVGATYVVGGRGIYHKITDSYSRAALKMMGRPEVTYTFFSQPTLNFDTYIRDHGTSPAEVLESDTTHAGTKTVHDDGSINYAFTGKDGEAFTFQVAAAGSLTSAHVTDDNLSATITFAYGPQTVTLPAASVTVSSTTLARGVAYLEMPGAVKGVAKGGAEVVRGKAHGHTVKVASLRKTIKHEAKVFNAKLLAKIVKVKNVSRGVKVYATNPWTHKTVSYTVKASGRKVVVTRVKAAAASAVPAGTARPLTVDLPPGWLNGLLTGK
ncbi:hypothetical protein [Krasilnikovia sp. M28-CT-15]|uniref:hypothetical protein n=1 Tax=Krasilnikovia sp. M28-CT-15 TaxID=3373540 RepID=UPI0038777691